MLSNKEKLIIFEYLLMAFDIGLNNGDATDIEKLLIEIEQRFTREND